MMDGSMRFGVICDECRGEEEGIRYKCNECPNNYDLCKDCKEKGIHSYHSMREIHPQTQAHAPPSTDHRHRGTNCDGCVGPIRGIRYKCTSCPAYYLCSDCKRRGIHREHGVEEVRRSKSAARLQLSPSVQAINAMERAEELTRIAADNALASLNRQMEAIGLDYTGTPFSIGSRNIAGGPFARPMEWRAAAAAEFSHVSKVNMSESIHQGPTITSPSIELNNARKSSTKTGRISPEIDVKVSKPFKETASPPKATRNPVAVRKIHVVSDEYTLKWAPENSSAPYNRVQLSASDDEFKRVIQNMDQMGGMKYKNKVAMISRIENHGVYKTYSSCRDYLKRLNDTGAVIERTLWHGTSADALTNIYRGGFNRGYCGKNATAYGDGVYFATSFDYSASPVYSPPDIKGQKYIFQCRVLTGQFSKGSQGLIEPPMRTAEFRFDSVVDDVSAPTMFIVFKDMQVYPEYVITLKL